MRHWITRASALLVAAALLSPGVASAQSDEWAKTVEAANKEGALALSMHQQDGLANVAKAFQAKYPAIKVNFTLENIAVLTPKLIAEQRNGQFLWDVTVIPTSNAATVLTPAGAFQDFPPLLILPEAKDAANWHGGLDMWANNVTNTKTVFIHSARLWGGVGVNRDFVPKAEFSSLEQLLDPKWRGKIVIDEPNAPRLGSITIATFLKDKGPDFVQALFTKQQPVYTTNPRLAMEWFATGRYPFVLCERPDLLLEFQKSGVFKAWDVVAPQYLATWGIAAFTKAPHPNATKVFANWFLTKQGQDAFVAAIGADGGVSRRKDVTSLDPAHTPEWSKLGEYFSPNQEKDAPYVRQVIDMYNATKK